MSRIFGRHGDFLTMLVFGTFLVAALSGCSPRMASATEFEKVEPTAVSLIWNNSRKCTVCHVTQAESITNGNLMTEHSELTCIDCHTNEEALENAHADLTYSSKPKLDALRMTDVSASLCIDCHGDWETLSEKTEEVTVLTDYNGTTVNPHTITTLWNQNGEHDNTTCGSCHSMHDDTAVEDSAVYYCLGCHHENVYECGTCHD